MQSYWLSAHILPGWSLVSSQWLLPTMQYWHRGCPGRCSWGTPKGRNLRGWGQASEFPIPLQLCGWWDISLTFHSMVTLAVWGRVPSCWNHWWDISLTFHSMVTLVAWGGVPSCWNHWWDISLAFHSMVTLAVWGGVPSCWNHWWDISLTFHSMVTLTVWGGVPSCWNHCSSWNSQYHAHLLLLLRYPDILKEK